MNACRGLVSWGASMWLMSACATATRPPHALPNAEVLVSGELVGTWAEYWSVKGGVDTQRVFDQGSPAQVRDDVLENIEALAPGGGWIFTTIHNTQASVPPENYMAMWETLQEKRRY